MHRHSYFDLLLHDDAELSSLLGCPIADRRMLHEWPLSCVQRVTTADDTRIIYKAQAAPTIEPEFYVAARSPLLPAARTIYRTERHACMLIEFIDGPRLADLRLPAAEVVRIGRTVIEAMAQIEGRLPDVLDVGSPEAWKAAAESMLRALSGLVEAGSFAAVDVGALRAIERAAASESVLDAVSEPAGLVHSDLGSNNVFILRESYRVIDWQYPKRGPADLDLAILLESTGLDSRDYVDIGFVRLMNLLRIHWLTECAMRWFTPGIESYDRQIAHLAAQL
jgi:Phosphotransferase enzyme family